MDKNWVVMYAPQKAFASYAEAETAAKKMATDVMAAQGYDPFGNRIKLKTRDAVIYEAIALAKEPVPPVEVVQISPATTVTA